MKQPCLQSHVFSSINILICVIQLHFNCTGSVYLRTSLLNLTAYGVITLAVSRDRNGNQNRFYAETICTGCVQGQYWTPESH